MLPRIRVGYEKVSTETKDRITRSLWQIKEVMR